MCGSKPKAPDTRAQEAEAARQREEERARYEAQLAEQQRIAEEQRLASERAAAEQRMLLQQQIDAQNQAIARAESQRRAAEQAAAARAAAEREAAERAARERAANMQAYATGRTERVNTLTGDINSAFAGFDDAYFDKFAQDYLGYYTPQVTQQYDDAVKQLTFKYANQGGINSSAAAQELGRLQEKRRLEEGKVANDAATAAGSFRGDIDSQRNALLSEALAAVNIGPEVLPEGVSDVAGQLSMISDKLAPYSDMAKQRASGISAPGYSDLGNLFGGYVVSGGSAPGGTSPDTFNFNTDNLYQPRQNGAVRIVV